MTYQYEDTRRRHDPVDPYTRSGLRPHEFPPRGEAGMGGLAVAGVLAAIVALVVVMAALSGGDQSAPAATDGAAPAAAQPPTGG